MKLIIQPDDGVTPLVQAVKNAKKTIDIVIFRFDRLELEKALEAAVARGVVVRALIAHTNRGGEKMLRKLELRLLDAGVTVARTADDLTRYHGKMMIVDDTLHVYGFNYTRLDIEKSRSFGVITDDPKLVKEACALFEADCTRQAYAPKHDELVVSPWVRLEPREALVHVRGYPEHVVLVAVVAQVPPAEQASDGGLPLPAVLADHHERVGLGGEPGGGHSNAYASGSGARRS